MALPTQILTIKNKNDNLENARDKLNNMVNKIKNFRFDMDNLDYIAAGMVNGEKRYFNHRCRGNRVDGGLSTGKKRQKSNPA